MKQEQKSNCCNSTFKSISSNEGTGYYACDKCGKPCDVYTEQNKDIRHKPICDINCDPNIGCATPHTLGQEKRGHIGEVLQSKKIYDLEVDFIKDEKGEYFCYIDFTDSNHCSMFKLDFISKALLLQKEEYTKIMNSGRKMYQLGKKTLREELVKKIEKLRTDERKTATFGEYVVESYNEKQCANAIIDEVISLIKEE